MGYTQSRGRICVVRLTTVLGIRFVYGFSLLLRFFLCDMVCDKVCDMVCDKVCDMVCDMVKPVCPLVGYTQSRDRICVFILTTVLGIRFVYGLVMLRAKVAFPQ